MKEGFSEGVTAWGILLRMVGAGQGLISHAKTSCLRRAFIGKALRMEKGRRRRLNGRLGGFDLCGGDQTREVISNKIQGFLPSVRSAALFPPLYGQFVLQI